MKELTPEEIKKLELERLELERRFEDLKKNENQNPTLPDKDNPFENFDMGEDGDNLQKVIGTFQENYQTPDFRNYLGESIDVSDSSIEISALNSVDIVNNSTLRINLEKYGEAILKKASQLARDVSFSFENNKIPEAFQQGQTSDMIEYLKDPIVAFPEHGEYLTEFQARLFEWLDKFDVPAYENLVSLLNEINCNFTTINSRILIAFVAAMAVPKICAVIYKTNNTVLTSAKLLKYDIQYFIYTAVINTPHYRDFMLKKGRIKEINEIEELLNKCEEKRIQVSNSTAKTLEDIVKRKEELEEIKKKSLQIKRLIGLTAVGMILVCTSYYSIKLIYDISITNHQEKLKAEADLTRYEADRVRKDEILDLKKQIKSLQGKIKSSNSTKEDYIINKNLINIILLKIKNIFKD